MAITLAVSGAAALWWYGGPPVPAGAAGAAPGPPGASPDVAVSEPAGRATGPPSRGGAARADRPRSSPPADPADPAEPDPEGDPAPVPDGGDVVATGSCEASYYWEEQPTASGEVFDPEGMTAAHKTWAFDTRVRVTNPGSGASVVVRINDRGPYVEGRCLDLARGAFREIGSLDAGVITVTYELLSD